MKSNIDHSSLKLFSIGVPVSANLYLHFISLTVRAFFVSGFL